MVEVPTPSEMNNLSERLNRPCDEHSHAILCNVLFLQLELDLNLIFRFHVMIRLLVYIYTKITAWCEDEERSIPLQVERKVKVNTRGKD